MCSTAGSGHTKIPRQTPEIQQPCSTHTQLLLYKATCSKNGLRWVSLQVSGTCYSVLLRHQCQDLLRLSLAITSWSRRPSMTEPSMLSFGTWRGLRESSRRGMAASQQLLECHLCVDEHRLGGRTQDLTQKAARSTQHTCSHMPARCAVAQMELQDVS